MQELKIGSILEFTDYPKMTKKIVLITDERIYTKTSFDGINYEMPGFMTKSFLENNLKSKLIKIRSES
jgi:hypothetical protein